MERILSGTPLAGMIAVADLARTVSAAFIGIELVDGVEDDRTGRAFAALEQIGLLAGLAADLGPLAGASLRRRLAARTR